MGMWYGDVVRGGVQRGGDVAVCVEGCGKRIRGALLYVKEGV